MSIPIDWMRDGMEISDSEKLLWLYEHAGDASKLPETSESDNGKILGVSSGEYALVDSISELTTSISNLRDELFFKNGDTLNVSSGFISGFFSSDSKTFHGVFIIPKSMKGLTPTLTGLTGSIRSINGVVDDASANIDFISESAYTVTCEAATDNSLRIKIAKSSAFKYGSNTNVSPNTPASFYGVVSASFATAAKRQTKKAASK